ncbi:bacterial proteasome activator family protein [Micromonospora sp. NPDC003197]
MDGMTEAPRSPEENDEPKRAGGAARPGTVLVVGPDGRPVGTAHADNESAGDDPARLIEQPAKVMRIGSMIKQLLEEVKSAPLDDASRHRLREIHQRSIVELEDGLAPELRDELARISLPFDEGSTPSESELRIAQAQLVGWLEGLFHGIQAALVAQQMAARLQLEQMRTGGRQALPMGPAGAGIVPSMPGGVGHAHPHPAEGGTGQYL